MNEVKVIIGQKMIENLSTIGRMFLNRTEISKNDNAIGWIEDGKVKFFTFQDYRNKIEALSIGLINLGLKEGDKLAILGNTSKEWHFFDLSTLCSKGITIPIYHTYLPAEIEYIYNHAECSFIVVEDDEQFKKILEIQHNLENLKHIITIKEVSEDLKLKLKNDVNTISYDRLSLHGSELLKTQPDLFEQNIKTGSPQQIATIIYTSGTTGLPKGAVITQGALSQVLHNAYQNISSSIFKGDRTLTFLPFSHVFGRVESYLSITFGSEMVFAQNMEKLIEDIQLVKPTFMLAVPRVFEKIYAKVIDRIEHEGIVKKTIFDLALKSANAYFSKIDKDLSPSLREILQYQIAYKAVFEKIYQMFGGRIRFFVSGGAPLSADIMKFLRNCNLTILEGYGLTESIGPSTLNPFSRQMAGTVGKPLGDVEVDFAPDGEILLKSKALMREYYKNPEATEEVLKDGWFYTGDIGKFNEHGFLVITDRKKDIIVTSGGKNVAPQKIENMMKLKPHITNFVCVGDQRKFLTGLVIIEKNDFVSQLSEMGLPLDSPLDQLANNPKIRAIIKEEIEQVNQHLAQFETIKKFIILPLDVTTDNYLTPSLKVKRKAITKDFKKEIDAMYQ